ncbi:MAG: thiamine pyrophosphate-requiring protein [Halobacteriales archaeon]
MSSKKEKITAAEAILRSLSLQGVEYLFANYGTDHTPLIEAAAKIRREDGKMPEIVVCPHEFVALSAAHGYAAATGKPQAVLVHVDVGTQNLGAAMHNAHRSNIPVVIISGLAPVTDMGHVGSRDHVVHYLQDTFQQSDIVREYCRWVTEYRPPANPVSMIRRAVALSKGPPAGPVYLTSAREALEVKCSLDPRGPISIRTTGADEKTVKDISSLVESADRPVIITSRMGKPPVNENVSALIEFVEVSGTGVVEHAPCVLNFPRNHPQHVGFVPGDVFDHADLIILADTDVPWVPSISAPAKEIPIIQIENNPLKHTYPHWDFEVDMAIAADPIKTLKLVSEKLDPADGESGRLFWESFSGEKREKRKESVNEQIKNNKLNSATISAVINRVKDKNAMVVTDATTSTGGILNNLELVNPGSYIAKYGSGLGFAGGAAVGAKMAFPDRETWCLVGDGAYLFTHPSVTAWLSAERKVPTLTVVYDNEGWNAVRGSTKRTHPEGIAVQDGIPESRFNHPIDFTAPSQIVGSHTESVAELDQLEAALGGAIEATENGKPAVIHVKFSD